VFAVPPNTILLPADPAAAHPVRIAREYATDPDRWRRELRYRADQRFVRLLERTPDHEVWLMSWLPGQCTEPHDHGGPTGAFTVVFGVLTESVFGRDGAVEAVHVLHGGQSRAFGPNYVHQVSNDGPDPAVSIHVFRPGRLHHP